MGRRAGRRGNSPTPGNGYRSCSQPEDDATDQVEEQRQPTTTMRKKRAPLASDLADTEALAGVASDKVAPDGSDRELEPEIQSDSSASTDLEDEVHPDKRKGQRAKHVDKGRGKKVRFVPLNEVAAVDNVAEAPTNFPPPPDQAVIPVKDGSEITVSAKAFADILSAYNVLRAFSWQLRLSPFSIEVSRSNGPFCTAVRLPSSSEQLGASIP
jgi:hypothetical protein